MVGFPTCNPSVSTRKWAIIIDGGIDRSAESAHCSLRPAASYDGSASNGQLKPRLSRGFFAGAPKRAPRRCASDFTTRPLQGPRPRTRVDVRRRPHGKVTGFTTSGNLVHERPRRGRRRRTRAFHDSIKQPRLPREGSDNQICMGVPRQYFCVHLFSVE
jgi:hypothetical protein